MLKIRTHLKIGVARAVLYTGFVVGFGAQVAAETLPNAVVQSIMNNAARKASIASIEAQEKQVAVIQAGRLPRVDIFGEVAGERIDDPTTLDPADNDTGKLASSIGVTVTHSLVDGMRSLNTLYREATLLDAEIIRLSDATETLALNAVQAYIDVLRHQGIVSLAVQNIANHQRIVSQVEDQVIAGRLSQADRFRAGDKLLAAQLARAEAQKALDDAASQYQLVIGRAPTGGMSMHSGVKLPASLSALMSNALTNSHQLKLAQNDIQALTYQGEIDASEWRPQIDLFALADVGDNRGGSSGNDSRLATGLRLNWTLHNELSRTNTVARNRDLIMRAHYQKKQLEDEVSDFARRSWIGYQSAVEQKALLDRAVATNVRIVEAFREEFAAAKRPLLQVLDAERALFNQRVQRLNAAANVSFQQYKILAAQNTLADHFGLAHSGRVLNPDFEQRVKAAPRNVFSVSVPPLE